MTVTREMIDRALHVWHEDHSDGAYAMRAALEAVAPMLVANACLPPIDEERNKLIAQGMRDAAEWLPANCHEYRTAILARAQELDSQ